MLLMVSTVMIVYGFLSLQLKDLLWYDQVVTGRLFGRMMVRTEAWDQQHDRWALRWMAIGALLLVVWAFTIPL